MPHFKRFPLPELPEKVQRFNPIKAIPFLQPIMKQYELSWIIFIIKADAFLADGVVLLESFFLLFLESAVIDDF
jgi:hypothetical protein